MQQRNIAHFASNSDKIAAVVVRFYRTLKNRLFTYMTACCSVNYIDSLKMHMRAYNNLFYRSISILPSAVRKSVRIKFVVEFIVQGTHYKSEKIYKTPRLATTEPDGSNKSN